MGITSRIFGCQRCSHEWLARKEGTPRECPRCQSAGWQTPRPPRPYVVKERTPGKVGAPFKYPVHELQPGETRIFPWVKKADGSVDGQAMTGLQRAISREVKLGKRFYQSTCKEGVVVTLRK